MERGVKENNMLDKADVYYEHLREDQGEQVISPAHCAVCKKGLDDWALRLPKNKRFCAECEWEMYKKHGLNI